MADGYVVIDAMSGGSSVATDNIGGTSHQYVKLEYGASGAATPVSAVNPLPTTIASGTIAISAGTTIVTSGSIAVTDGTVKVITPGTIASGSIAVTAGTITSGSIAVTAGTIGTVLAVAQVHNAGTIAGGTLGILTDGTIRVVAGTVAVNTPGTITSGSIAVTAGTITSGSIVVTDGTVKVVTPGTITSGSIAITAGTLADVTVRVGTINSGTINAGTINSGTINAGTINAGTIRNDGRPARNILSFGTTIAFGGSAFATLVGSAVVGAGTSIWINDLSIVNGGGTVTAGMVFGSAINGSAVLAKGMFGAQGGIQKSFPKAVNAGMTNFDLNAWADGASTVTFNVSYFISA